MTLYHIRIRTTAAERLALSKVTRKPLVLMSCDAHKLVDELNRKSHERAALIRRVDRHAKIDCPVYEAIAA